MTDYGKVLSPGKTHQQEKARENQVKGRAGGYVFQVDIWTLLDRFLILGVETPTYYAKQRDLVKQSAKCITDCLAADGERTVNRIAQISDEGRAPKNNPALFALAIAISKGDTKTRSLATEVLPRVARTASDLFRFVSYADGMRGWGRVLRNAVQNWYGNKEESVLAYQVLKYQQRYGWSHRDLLRKAHVKPETQDKGNIYNYITKGEIHESILTFDAQISSFEELKRNPSPQRAVELINKHRLTREMIPTQLLNDVSVWRALLEKMPLHATVRNLAKMTSIGLISPNGEVNKQIIDKLTDAAYINRSRMHPLSLLAAWGVYRSGQGVRGNLRWTPDNHILAALETGFHLGFDNVEPTGRRIMVGIDVSDSMGVGTIAGLPGLSPRIVAACLALTFAKTEQSVSFLAFSQRPSLLSDINAHSNLDQVQRLINDQYFGGTDCALPMLYAMGLRADNTYYARSRYGVNMQHRGYTPMGVQHRGYTPMGDKVTPYDAFVVITDNETWYGNIHPFEALKQYREKSGINAKLVVVGLTADKFSIADPSDAGMLDVVGGDTSMMKVVSDFIRN